MHDRMSRLVARPLFWALLIAMGVGVPIARTLMVPPPPKLPVLGTLPAFNFTNQYAQPFGSPQLRGKVWIANFIFTRCPTVCPRFSAKMASLQTRLNGLEPTLHLVSFSVDPAFDQPPVLLQYAERYKANPRMWTFLTGDYDALKTTVVEGLKISMGRNPGPDDVMSLFHGTHFVLLDGEGQIRGYYESNDDEAVERLVRDAGLLANVAGG